MILKNITVIPSVMGSRARKSLYPSLRSRNSWMVLLKDAMRVSLKAKYDNGLFATYFYHEVTEYDLLDKSHHGQHHVRANAFKRHDLPLFLEGFVHAMRTESSSVEAKALYKAVRSSKLFDRKLGCIRSTRICPKNPMRSAVPVFFRQVAGK